MDMVMEDAKYSAQFIQSMKEAQESAKLVANQLSEIVSLNVKSREQLDELKEEIMEKVDESESSQEALMNEFRQQYEVVLEGIQENIDETEEHVGKMSEDMYDMKDNQAQFEENVKEQNLIRDYALRVNRDRLIIAQDHIYNVDDDLQREKGKREEEVARLDSKIDDKVATLRKEADANKVELNRKLKETRKDFGKKIAAAKKNAKGLADEAKRDALKEVKRLEAQEAARTQELETQIQQTENKVTSQIGQMQQNLSREVAAAAKETEATIQEQLNDHQAQLDEHKRQLNDHERRLKKLEIGLDDGSVVKVILYQGTYYLKCEKHPGNGKKIICNTTGTDGMNYQRVLDRKGAGGPRDIIPKGAPNVQDTIVVKDTQGKKTSWRISFTSGSSQATLEKLPDSLYGGSLFNTSNYSHIINPLNGRFVDITSRLGNKILKNYIRALI